MKNKTDEFNFSLKNNSSIEKKLTHSQLAKILEMKTADLNQLLISAGYFEIQDAKQYLSLKGKASGGESRVSPKFGTYFLWPLNFKPII